MELDAKNLELQQIREYNQMNIDAIGALSDQVTKLTREIETLKKKKIQYNNFIPVIV